MNTQTLGLSGSCRLELTTYEGSPHRSVSLDYTEHSPDLWFSNSETSINLDAPKAREIIAFLHNAFPELAPKPSTDARIAEILSDYIIDEDEASPTVELVAALVSLKCGYLNLLEGGRDRILALGGDCDTVERMKEGSPYLKEADATLSKYGA